MKDLLPVTALLLGACSALTEGDVFKTYPLVDDRVALKGTVCTTPSAPADFPLKVVLVVDSSGSMCVTDPPGSQGSAGFCESIASSVNAQGLTSPRRITAISALVDFLATVPAAQVSLVKFDTGATRVWPAGVDRFAPPTDALRATVATLAADLGSGTDYQGALEQVADLVTADVVAQKAADPARLARTRYLVLFVSDGTPFPRCSSRDALSDYADDLDPTSTWPDSLGAGDVCNVGTPELVGFVPGSDRNQNAQIFDPIERLVALEGAYNVGKISLSTTFLFNTEAVEACGPICADIYGRYQRWPGPTAPPDNLAAAKSIARWTLQEMARRGHGAYFEYNDHEGMQKLNVRADANPTTLYSPSVLTALFVEPRSSMTTAQRRLLDTDGDGLADIDETASNPRVADSDGDGFEDGFEAAHADAGFRADTPDSRGCPALGPCVDADHDGLSDLAERYLGSSAAVADTDRDGLPDAVEARHGLDPSTAEDAGTDSDGDGVADLDELRAGSSPRLADAALRAAGTMQATVTTDGGSCSDFRITGVQMVGAVDGGASVNTFRVWFAEAPASVIDRSPGTWRAACVSTTFSPPRTRTPAGPDADALADAHFLPLATAASCTASP